MSDYTENGNYRSDDTPGLSDNMNYPAPDLTYLNAMAEGDENFIKEIITYFLENCPGMLVLIRESALSGDFEKLRFTAHQLLPQLTFVGILAAIPDVTKIESEGKHLDDLSGTIERAIKIINWGIEDLKKLI